MEASEVRKISADETLPLRSEILRPGLPLSASRFDKDQSPQAGHFGVFVNGKSAAVGSVYPEACEASGATAEMKNSVAWRLRGMATDPSFRSQGFGAEVLKACLAHAKALGAKTVWAHGRTGAIPFYIRHGFQTVGGEYNLPGVGPHYLIRIDL